MNSVRSLFSAMSPRGQRITAAGAIIVGLLAIYAVWFAWAIGSGAVMAKSAASSASQAAKSGDAGELQEAVANLHAAAVRANSAIGSPGVTLVAHIPVLGTSIGDIQHFSAAGVSASEAAAAVAPAYQANIFQDQTINLATMDAMLAALPNATTSLTETANQLAQVQGTGVGGAAITEYRNNALAGVATLEVAATQLSTNRQAVLQALGSDGPKNYLIPLLNNAQLRASGGAPLSAAVVTINKGKISIPFNGYINGKAYKGHPSVNYTSVAPIACQPSPAECASVPLWGAPSAGLSFVNSSAHPDWRMSGDDLHRAWNASQPLKVSGVVALDTNAIESLLGIVGPIETKEYGEVTAENFTDLILESAYDEFANDQSQRQDVNDEIGQAVISKLLNGNALTLGETVSAMVVDAQGRNVQAWFENPVLEQAALTLGAGGEIKTAPNADTIAVYSRNRNSSKVDVYSQRELAVEATVTESGGATVTQTLDVTNDATSHGNAADKVGYQTNLSANDWFFVLPPGAKNAKLLTPAGYDHVTVHSDGLGRQVLATTGEIPAGQSAQLSLTYELPAGTFTDPDGAVTYRTYLNPQPLQAPINLALNVTMPYGGCTTNPAWDATSSGASYEGPLNRTQELTVTCRP